MVESRFHVVFVDQLSSSLRGSSPHNIGSNISIVYQWTAHGDFVKMATTPSIAWGFVALTCSNVMVFTSTTFMRQRFYRLFFIVHVIGFSTLLPAVRVFSICAHCCL
jgi:hypothetical protein